ncbi:MAG TPA: cation diffusion facilitator family transporter [Fimbriimonas sp.]|nr:cation diffusion facilitator family transporter [Fimbriimonas sp.]
MQQGSIETEKRRAATLSLFTNSLLTGLKLVAAAVTGSVSLFTEAAHSATDVVTSALAFVSVRAAAAPPDEEHPYGHGKIESLAGFGEAILLMAIVVYIAFQAASRLLTPQQIPNLFLGLLLMAGSAAASAIVGFYVSGVGKRTSSIVLQSNGQHFLIDFWTSFGVLVALGVTHFTGWKQADPIFALLLAIWIARNAWLMSVKAFQELIDHRVSDQDLRAIEDILASDSRVLSYHKLRTRHSGSVHYIELHVVVSRDYSLVEAHEVADSIEKGIESALSPCHAVIHVDPDDPSKHT